MSKSATSNDDHDDTPSTAIELCEQSSATLKEMAEGDGVMAAAARAALRAGGELDGDE